MESTILLKLMLQILGGGALILAAILDYVAHDKRTTRFRRGRLILFIMLGVLLIVSVISVYEDDHNIRRENRLLAEHIETLQAQIRQEADSAAFRNLLLIKQIMFIEGRLETVMRKTGTKLPDTLAQKELNSITSDLDKLKEDIQKLNDPTDGEEFLTFKVFIKANPDRAHATIYIDGKSFGTPLDRQSIEVTKGRHELRLEYIDVSYREKWVYVDSIYVANDFYRRIHSDEFRLIKTQR